MGLFLTSFIAAGGCAPKRSSPEEPRQAEFAKPGPGDVATLVRSALGEAQQDKRRLLVYVGAHWCEPCRYFQEAVAADALPEEFDNLRFLKFDYDADKERLSSAGYESQMIPLYVVPNADGTGSAHRFAGAIKGPEAVELIVTKLRTLVPDSP